MGADSPRVGRRRAIQSALSVAAVGGGCSRLPDRRPSGSTGTEDGRAAPPSGGRRVPPGDHLAGIQAAVDDSGPSVVELAPDGEYVGRGLTVDHRTVIVGNGATLRREDGATGDLLTTPDPERRNAGKCRFYDLTFDANRANTATGNAVYGAFWQSRFLDCEFVEAPERALWIAGSAASTDDNVFSRCRFLRSGDALDSSQRTVQFGYSKQSARAVGAASLRRCWFGDNASGVVGLRGNGHSVVGSKFYGNDGPSVTFDRSKHAVLTDCELATDRSVEAVIEIVARNGATARRNVVSDNVISNAFDAAVRCRARGDDVVACLVNDNVVDATAGAVRGVVAEGEGDFRRCSLQGNVFAGRYRDAPVGELPDGWTVANNVA